MILDKQILMFLLMILKLEELYNLLKKKVKTITKVQKLPIEEKALLGIKETDTYMFHPLKYIEYWKEKYQDFIYENSQVTKIDKKDGNFECLVNDYKIKAKYVIIASNYPYFLVPYFTPLKNHVETSYIGGQKS